MRYSILVPVLNGMPYLESTMRTILAEPSKAIEVLVSDDHSDDGSSEFLAKVDDPRVRLLRPARGLSMSEHWDWLLSHAVGDWQMFVGQDDGLHEGFFSLAETVTSFAEASSLRAISTRRSYYFWPGTEDFYSGWRAKHVAWEGFHIRDMKKELYRALRSEIDYFDLPHMYVSSLWHRSLIQEAREKAGGTVILSHPQDASLVAVASSLEKQFLRSETPLAWVGSSLKSAGLAVTLDLQKNSSTPDEVLALSTGYQQRVASSHLSRNSNADSFGLASSAVYLLQSVAEVVTRGNVGATHLFPGRASRAYILAAAWDALSFRSKTKSALKILHQVAEQFSVSKPALWVVLPAAVVARRSRKLSGKLGVARSLVVELLRGRKVTEIRAKASRHSWTPEYFVGIVGVAQNRDSSFFLQASSAVDELEPTLPTKVDEGRSR